MAGTSTILKQHLSTTHTHTHTHTHTKNEEKLGSECTNSASWGTCNYASFTRSSLAHVRLSSGHLSCRHKAGQQGWGLPDLKLLLQPTWEENQNQATYMYNTPQATPVTHAYSCPWAGHWPSMCMKVIGKVPNTKKQNRDFFIILLFFFFFF